jgi:hypothetical protein
MAAPYRQGCTCRHGGVHEAPGKELMMPRTILFWTALALLLGALFAPGPQPASSPATQDHLDTGCSLDPHGGCAK